MSDDDPELARRLATAAEIDQEALKRWFTLPDDGEVVLHASRPDMDLLFLGLRQLAFSQGASLAALFQMRSAPHEDVSNLLSQARDQHVNALENLTRFTSAIMTKARIDE